MRQQNRFAKIVTCWQMHRLTSIMFLKNVLRKDHRINFFKRVLDYNNRVNFTKKRGI